MDTVTILKKSVALDDLYPLLLLADPNKEKIDSYITKSDCFVLELNNEIIGVLLLQKINKTSLEIKNIAVSEEHQNKGFGKKLIKSIIKRTKNETENKLVVCTGNSSIDQLAFYQKLGFRIFDIQYNYFTQNYSSPILENGILCEHKICLELSV